MSESAVISCWRDLINDLIDEADDALRESSIDETNFCRGQLLGLRKALSLVKDYCPGYEELTSLLDFDPDDRYM